MIKFKKELSLKFRIKLTYQWYIEYKIIKLKIAFYLFLHKLLENING